MVWKRRSQATRGGSQFPSTPRVAQQRLRRIGALLAVIVLLLGLFWGHHRLEQAFSMPQEAIAQQAMMTDLQSATVVYLGETHDSGADHRAQLDLIQHLTEASKGEGYSPPLAIGLEMIQRPYQHVLDDYLAGLLSDSELRDRTEFDNRWGYLWEDYAPIFQFAQAEQIPLIALNTPTEATRHVAQFGWEGLDPAVARWIPPADDVVLGPPAYRDRLQTVYDDIHRGASYSLSFENFFLAQVLWDETMAMAIADYVRSYPNSQMVVLVGEGHVIYGHGIPHRVARRLSDRPDLNQRSLLLYPSPEQRAEGQGVIADYFWPNVPESISE